GLSPETLQYANKLSGNSLSANQALKIPAIDGIFIKIQRNDTLSSLAKKYHVSVDDIVKYNGLQKDQPIFSGQEILVPGVVVPKQTASANRYAPSAGSVPSYSTSGGAGQFIWPTQTPTHFISQGYSGRHRALDLNRLNGWAIYASASGIVRTYSTRGGYGNYIDINHGNGWVTRYGHLSEFKVKSGDYVQQGRLIAIMGSTGRSSGPHLHFEIRANGQPANPLSYLPR
ncbi:MAG: M23 family metallopeptidase, partial [bacterium]